MKKIELTQGQFALVDDEDFEYLNQWKWCIVPRKYTSYVYRAVYGEKGPMTRRGIYMHRLLLDPFNELPYNIKTDHIDGNGLNNQRNNLRISSDCENHHNRRKGNNHTYSKYKGVSFYKNSNKWCAKICCNGFKLNLGCFDSEILAAEIYDQKARELHGKFAKLNFL